MINFKDFKGWWERRILSASFRRLQLRHDLETGRRYFTQWVGSARDCRNCSRWLVQFMELIFIISYPWTYSSRRRGWSKFGHCIFLHGRGDSICVSGRERSIWGLHFERGSKFEQNLHSTPRGHGNRSGHQIHLPFILLLYFTYTRTYGPSALQRSLGLQWD